MVSRKVEVSQTPDNNLVDVISVPLINSDLVVSIYKTDFLELMAIGVDTRWKLYQGSVYQKGKGHINISRLICNAQDGQIVQFMDGNKMNLKRSNLAIAIGNMNAKAERPKLNRERSMIKTNASVKSTYINPSWDPNYYNNQIKELQ
jgi:hypothetical protein